MAEVKKLKCTQKTKSLKEISKMLRVDLDATAICEERRLNDSAVLICFERFYFRNGSYAGLTVMLTENEECQEAVVTGFGGGEGLFNISLGANSSFVNKAVKILGKSGFVGV